MGEGGGKLRRGLQEDCESKSGPFDEPSEWVPYFYGLHNWLVEKIQGIKLYFGLGKLLLVYHS